MQAKSWTKLPLPRLQDEKAPIRTQSRLDGKTLITSKRPVPLGAFSHLNYKILRITSYYCVRMVRLFEPGPLRGAGNPPTDLCAVLEPLVLTDEAL